MMKKNVIFLTFVLACIGTLSVVHSQVYSQMVEVQGTQYEVENKYDKSYLQASLLVYKVDGSKKNLVKTISSDDYNLRGGGYDVTNNYLYYVNHDNYVMRMSFYTFEIENINIQTYGDFEVTDNDSIICVSAKTAELWKMTSWGEIETLIPSLYDVKTKEKIEIKGFPIDSLDLAMLLSIEYDAERNGFTTEYSIDSPDPVFPGYISLDDFTYVETHLEMERPYRYYPIGDAWDPMVENQ